MPVGGFPVAMHRAPEAQPSSRFGAASLMSLVSGSVFLCESDGAIGGVDPSLILERVTGSPYTLPALVAVGLLALACSAAYVIWLENRDDRLARAAQRTKDRFQAQMIDMAKRIGGISDISLNKPPAK